MYKYLWIVFYKFLNWIAMETIKLVLKTTDDYKSLNDELSKENQELKKKINVLQTSIRRYKKKKNLINRFFFFLI